MSEGHLLAAVWRQNRICPILVVALVVLNIVAYLAASRLAEPRVQGLERTLIEKQALLRRAGQKAGSAVSPQTLFHKGEDGLAAFREAVPDKTEFSSLIGEVFSLAQGAGLSIDRITYNPEEVAERGLLEYGLVFSVAGDYSQIKKFIHSVEQSRRLVIIDEVSLGGSGAGKGSEVALRISFTTYFKSEDS
ncbi:MAG: hypothetical protein C0617_12755 [Desulfuromonas sp.]|uniref:type 4a pilus biogenesis protein PilO n=1 Tax=Desulfuromonas sp. TaxID=892 RepID=UPI000CAE5F28|nr:type 4a pilus biogenesis protein PilO [Desulfuromonas sp.]PLX83101.1 MAG: hypothetical protein C0617_12755 [Desulfuromonas sp.]